MARRVWTIAVLLSLTLSAIGCTSYQSLGASGGFSETQLSDTVYQVRFQGNGYTSTERTSQFLLRRAAELTLEQGKRYFVIGGVENQSRSDGLATYPAQSVTVRILQTQAEDPQAADAVTVIKQTDALAGGRLSSGARATLTGFGG